ncbi:formyltransferase family protein, partial [Bacillus sp. SIMBA_008]|uniref:formyltransferase family protein n=1 Tax=Bacillus sp. SIMBA_008 TaxID=3085757 RepID=UPI003979E80D
LHTHARALEARDAEHGASVHFVIAELDAGSVFAQARVPVLAGDDAATLADRVLAREHPLLIAALRLLASDRLHERQGRLILDGQQLFTP